MTRSVDTNQRVYFDIDRYESIIMDVLSYKLHHTFWAVFNSQQTEEYRHVNPFEIVMNYQGIQAPQFEVRWSGDTLLYS